ncbi:MAG: DUF805 domain-containing protein [Calditrichia bacterium]
MNWYVEVLKKYAVFDGRARRMEYWMFVLFNLIMSLIVNAVDWMLGTGGILGFLYMIAVFIPSLAVSVRRLHDIGKSGWWMLLIFIPILGAIILIIFFIMDSQEGDNQYGPNPKTTVQL